MNEMGSRLGERGSVSRGFIFESSLRVALFDLMGIIDGLLPLDFGCIVKGERCSFEGGVVSLYICEGTSTSFAICIRSAVGDLLVLFALLFRFRSIYSMAAAVTGGCVVCKWMGLVGSRSLTVRPCCGIDSSTSVFI